MPIMKTSAGIKVRDARPEDASEIARIFNQGVQDQLATFENTFARPEDRFLWIVARPTKYPVVVAQLKHTLVGWASLSPYSPKSCYNGIAELSIYIDRNYRSHGVGQLLMAALQQAVEHLRRHVVGLAPGRRRHGAGRKRATQSRPAFRQAPAGAVQRHRRRGRQHHHERRRLENQRRLRTTRRFSVSPAGLNPVWW